MEDRPIVFTISPRNDGCFVLYTRDGRVDDYNRETVFPANSLYNAMCFASKIYNDKGYAVLFEVD